MFAEPVPWESAEQLWEPVLEVGRRRARRAVVCGADLGTDRPRAAWWDGRPPLQGVPACRRIAARDDQQSLAQLTTTAGELKDPDVAVEVRAFSDHDRGQPGRSAAGAVLQRAEGGGRQ